MIFEDLVTTTKAMQDLQKKTAIRNNRELQKKVDSRYRILLIQVNQFVDTIEYLYNHVNVPKNHQILITLSSLLESLERVVDSGVAVQEEVVNAENSFKVIQADMKKEWAKQYVELTGDTVSTLKAIKGIAPDQVTDCLQKIQIAESWEFEVKKYQVMNIGLREAEKLIVSLGLDAEIIAFLQNTNIGRATLRDLDDKVLSWIKAEKLENKIRISFVKK